MTPTPEQVEAWARELGLRAHADDTGLVDWGLFHSRLAKFAALACAWQRERDATFAHNKALHCEEHDNYYGENAALDIEDTIREDAEAIRSDCAEGEPKS